MDKYLSMTVILQAKAMGPFWFKTRVVDYLSL